MGWRRTKGGGGKGPRGGGLLCGENVRFSSLKKARENARVGGLLTHRHGGAMKEAQIFIRSDTESKKSQQGTVNGMKEARAKSSLELARKRQRRILGLAMKR